MKEGYIAGDSTCKKVFVQISTPTEELVHRIV